MTKNLKDLAEEQISNMQSAYAGKIPPEFWLSLERNFEFFAESVIKSTLQEVEERVPSELPEFVIPDCENCGEREAWGKAWYGKGAPNDPHGFGDAYYPTGSVVFCKECSDSFNIGREWNGEEIWKRTSTDPQHEQIRINSLKTPRKENKGHNSCREQILSALSALKIKDK